ncbi:MAG: hypothetical protein M1401_15615 [Chloroflexi bacterium]|nr:hypothetical protein [Chloroflexota bacterium]MCL5110251.1 hypothetical protein [Chloroflexota bacterium]MCL5110256.1 hypothetical protein [Chloroflexota bacterium]
MKKTTKLTVACAIIFADFPLLYHGTVISRDPAVAVATLVVLAMGVGLALAS